MMATSKAKLYSQDATNTSQMYQTATQFANVGILPPRPASTKRNPEDVCCFIKVTDKQKEYLKPETTTSKHKTSVFSLTSQYGSTMNTKR